jgi:phosphoribosylaminoimidazole-succinocarboxamide synthase
MIPAAPPLRHVASGKVRDVYALDHERLVMVASDRVSAYDHVLETPIPDKGRVLTALSLWWFERLSDVAPNHLAWAAPDPAHLPVGCPEAWRGRAMVVRRLEMVPVECVARGYLAGSGVTDLRAAGTLGGVALPRDLPEGSRLTEPVFTPATKAAMGEHDENVSYADMAAQVGEETAGELRRLTLALYARAHELAAERGIVLADTKFEFGRDRHGVLTLADEVLTPDSSRFWPAESWAPGGPQPSFDKQFVRDWLTSPASGWSRTSGEAPPQLPAEVVERTRGRYLEAYERLTGRSLD